MINSIDRAVERYLRDEVPLSESTVGVAFDPPDKDWGAALSRPTVNVFLWDVSRSERMAVAGLEEREGEEGRERRLASPRVDFRYIITAWTSDVADEHLILGSILRTVLAKRELAADSLPDGLVEGPCRLSVEGNFERPPAEFWSGLGTKFKPSVRVAVSALVPVNPWVRTTPAPTSIDVGVEPTLPGPATDGRPAARWAPNAEASSSRRLRRTGVIASEGRPEPGI